MFNIFGNKIKYHNNNEFSDEMYEHFYKERKELLAEINFLEGLVKDKDREIKRLKNLNKRI